ncbi:MAG: hypothetical protein M0R28_05610 [Pigmentiphaga sp.]|nr:hypothetical protein [Pigmentiphaga sp.]
MQELLIELTRRELDKWRGGRLADKPEHDGWQAGLWTLLESLELPRCLASEPQGGSGVGLRDAFALMQLIGEYALPVPLVETILAHHLLSMAGLTGPAGPLSISSHPDGPCGTVTLKDRKAVLNGRGARVPWGRDVAGVVLLADHGGETLLVLVRQGQFEVQAGLNTAADARDTLEFRNSEIDLFAGSPIDSEGFYRLAAAARVAQMAGACREILQMSVSHANTREQFGRPIAKFQAIQQHLASLASLWAICAGASDLAIRSLEAGGNSLGVACAKARAGEAASAAAAAAHQVLGAMGFSREHGLHRCTQRLLSWRDEFGSEAYWNERLGALAISAGADGLWPILTD